MGHIAADLPDRTIPLALVQPSGERAAQTLGRMAGGLIVVTVPPAARPVDTGAVAAMVTQAVRAVVSQPRGAADDVAVAQAEPQAPDEASDAVVAAHDARIAILRQRLAALQGVAGTTRLFDDLGARLRRAEAARRLAVARASGDASLALGCRIDAPSCSDRGTVAAAGMIVDGHALPERRIPALSRHVRGEVQLAVAPYRLVSRTVIVQHSGSASPHRRVAAASFVHPTLASARPGRSASRLAAARRSLAMARALLEAAPVGRMASGRAIAGLWRWDGSDRWALRPDVT